MKTRLLIFFLAFGLTLLSNHIFAQSIAYNPSIDTTLTVGTPIPTLSPNGAKAATFGFGGGQLIGTGLSNPWGMAIDPSGNIYVTNYGNNTVSEYSSTGASKGTYGLSSLSNPVGIAFDALGNGYVLNFNHTNSGTGNYNDNAYVSQYAAKGDTIIYGLGTATGITMNASNNLYIAEGSANKGNNTVAQYNTLGYLAFSLSGTTNPVAVAVDNSGNIYVLDNTNKNVTGYTSTGTLLASFTTITGLSNPNAIYIDGAGNIYIGDSGTGSVKVYNSSGTTLLTSITGLTDPRGIVTDSQGNLYVSDYTNNTVTKYPPIGGYYLSGTLPPGLSFNSSNGDFTGAPASSFNLKTDTVTAYFSSTSSATATVTLKCPGNSFPTISYSPSINVFTINSPITPWVPVTTNSPNSFSISPGLPAGLNFDTVSGTITGTPDSTSLQAATLYTISAIKGGDTAKTVISIACVKDDYWIGQGGGGNGLTDWNLPGNWSTGKVPAGPTDVASIGVIGYHGDEPEIKVNTSVYNITFGAARAGKLTVDLGDTLTVKHILTVNNNATPILTGHGTINIVPAALVDIAGSGVLTIDQLNPPLIFTLQSDSTGSASVEPITTGLITGPVHVERYFQGSGVYDLATDRWIERGYRIISSPVHLDTMVNGNYVYSINYIVGSTANNTSATSTTNCYITGCAGGTTALGNPSTYLYNEGIVPYNFSFTGGNFPGITYILNSTNPNNVPGVGRLYGTIGVTGVSNSGRYSIPIGTGVFFFDRGNATNFTARTHYPFVAVENVTLTSIGTINQGQIIAKDWYTPTSSHLGYTVFKSSTDTTTNYAVRGFNMVGNPYPCSIDWNTYNTSSLTTGIYTAYINPTIWVFNPVTYQYDTYNSSDRTGTGNATNIIVSGQGFFVQATNPSAKLVFNESAKSPLSQLRGPSLLMGKPVAQAPSQLLRLKLAIDSLNYDDIVVGFNSGASPKYNGAEDAEYMPGVNAMEGLSSFSADNVPLAINYLPLPKQTPEVIKLDAEGWLNGSYTLQRTALDAIPQLYEVWLMDNYKKDSLDLRHNTTYTFDMSDDPNSYGPNRFQLVIRQNPALGVHLLNFAANKASGGAQVVWKTENEQNYTNFTVERSSDGGATFDVLGGIGSSALGTYSFLDENPPLAADQYRLKIEDLNGAISYSNVVTLIYGNSNDSKAGNISVYPNPASNVINLAINQKSGSTANLSGLLSLGTMPSLAATPTNSTALYDIKIVSVTGSIIKSVTSSSANWQGNVSGLAPGTYFIQVYNKNDKSLVGRNTFVKL
ncbi:MAG TPA: T9SS type A sorting domain-containing protein [Mucilaginibacter sp.]|jgi:streptogramin lyase